MLILTRKSQESIVVSGADGCHILMRVTVLGIERGKVRLGIETASDTPVGRQEVWERARAFLSKFPMPDPQSSDSAGDSEGI